MSIHDHDPEYYNKKYVLQAKTPQPTLEDFRSSYFKALKQIESLESQLKNKPRYIENSEMHSFSRKFANDRYAENTKKYAEIRAIYFKGMEDMRSKTWTEKPEEIVTTFKDEIKSGDWDWWGWLCARIPHLNDKNAYRMWIAQCFSELMSLNYKPEESYISVGWLFDGRRYDKLEELSGKTMSHGYEPKEIFIKTNFTLPEPPKQY